MGPPSWNSIREALWCIYKTTKVDCYLICQSSGHKTLGVNLLN